MSDESLFRTPAGRLLRICQRGKQLLHELRISGQGGKPTLIKLLNPESADPAWFPHYFGLFLRLPHDVEREFRLLPRINHDKYLRWVKPVVEHWDQCAIAHGLNQYMTPLTEERLCSIEVCHDQFLAGGFADGVDEESIAEIR